MPSIEDIIENIPVDFDDSDDDALDKYVDYDDIESAYQVTNEHDFDTFVVLDNVPVVDESKKDKLMIVVKKRFTSNGIKIKEDGMTMPMAKDAKSGKMMSKGFMFIEFETPEDAERSLKTMQGHAFDKNHSFFLNKFSDVGDFADATEEWDEVAAVGEEKAFVEKEYLKGWLMDTRYRDQYVIVKGVETSIAWNNKSDEAEIAYSRKNWSDGWVQWSPLGTYLATFHRQGIAIWGGNKMNKIMRFMHPFVSFAEFSPCENYLVTMSPNPLPPAGPNTPWTLESSGHTICVWEVATGVLARSFPPPAAKDSKDGRPPVEWPVFKWSWDDKYFTRLTPGSKISVYETPSMGLVGKQSINIAGVAAFEWAPYKPEPEDTEEEKKYKSHQNQKKTRQYPYLIAYYTPQKSHDQPAQLAIMSIPDRQVVRQKQVFYVTGCRIHFQDNGEYLVFSLQRTNRSGKALYHTIDTFRLNAKDIPSDTVDVQAALVAFSWEPSGNRFAIITTSETVPPGGDMKTILGGTAGKMSVSFYEVESAQEKRKGGRVEVLTPGGVKLLKTLERKSVNSLFWSPKGRFIVLAGLRNLQTGELEFWDLNSADNSSVQSSQTTTSAGITVISKKEAEPIQMIGSGEHYCAGQVSWDPSGRYVISALTMFMRPMDNGIILWDFNGTLLLRTPIDHLKQIAWRPRPSTLISKSKQKSIRKNLKEYVKEFEEEDLNASYALSAAELAERKRLVDEWYAWRKSVEKEYKAQKNLRRALRHGAASDDEGDDNEVDEWVEEVVEEREEIVN